MKMKGAVAPIESSLFADVYVDPRTRFNKHQSLAQDYKELQKETEAMKKKLLIMKQKKMTLIAEVRFLRRRYKYLIQNKSSKTPKARTFMQPQNSDLRSKQIIKEMKYNGKEAGLPPPVPRFDLNQKGKVHVGKDATHVRTSAPIFDLNQKHRIYSHGNEALRNSFMIPDLNLAERVYNNGKETTMRSMTPVFDLNQISREEEELAACGETMLVEDLKNNSIRSGNEELLSDMKLSVCRNIGNGSNRAGKRKISWQDQVALRV
ncbi:uncharacterized protein LOC110815636 [Carica papaya]|uniref:uncharacterized protein LOC110815636 n=1 Tax=Carica papaya TaxID=3649 RepID=UPI000B8C9AE0|nr:uncharacterized protein LOC110815636 [Carica papaya]